MSGMTQRELENYLIEQQASLYRLAYSCLHDREDALDAVQSAVCKALEKRPGLRDASAVRAWTTRILWNCCTDLLRQRQRTVPLEAAETTGCEDPPPEDDSLGQRVEALAPELRTVIRLRFYQELTLQEIAEVTGCPLSTVKTRLYTALKRLRVSMEGAIL